MSPLEAALQAAKKIAAIGRPVPSKLTAELVEMEGGTVVCLRDKDGIPWAYMNPTDYEAWYGKLKKLEGDK